MFCIIICMTYSRDSEPMVHIPQVAHDDTTDYLRPNVDFKKYINRMKLHKIHELKKL